MDDVRGDFLGPPHGTTPAAVVENKNKGSSLSSFNSKTNMLCLWNVLTGYSCMYQWAHVKRALRSQIGHRTSSALHSELGLHIVVQKSLCLCTHHEHTKCSSV